MYERGAYVVHPGQGVCKVESVTDGPNAVYKLMPVDGRHSLVISFPVGSEQRLRPVLSQDEALRLIESYPTLQTFDFTATTGMAEEQHFKETMKNGNCSVSVRVVKTFRSRIKRAQDSGRKPPVAYERLLKEASLRSLSELSVALNCTPADVARLFKEQEGDFDLSS